MFFSDAVICVVAVIPSSSVSIAVVVVVAAADAAVDVVMNGSSMGIVRTERGRFPWALLRGLGGANFTGEGERDGSFSLFSSSSSSGIDGGFSYPCECCICSLSITEACGCVGKVPSSSFWVLVFFFIVTD